MPFQTTISHTISLPRFSEDMPPLSQKRSKMQKTLPDAGFGLGAPAVNHQVPQHVSRSLSQIHKPKIEKAVQQRLPGASVPKEVKGKATKMQDKTMDRPDTGVFTRSDGSYFCKKEDGTYVPIDDKLFFHSKLQRTVLYRNGEYLDPDTGDHVAWRDDLAGVGSLSDVYRNLMALPTTTLNSNPGSKDVQNILAQSFQGGSFSLDAYNRSTATGTSYVPQVSGRLGRLVCLELMDGSVSNSGDKKPAVGNEGGGIDKDNEDEDESESEYDDDDSDDDEYLSPRSMARANAFINDVMAPFPDP